MRTQVGVRDTILCPPYLSVFAVLLVSFHVGDDAGLHYDTSAERQYPRIFNDLLLNFAYL